MSKKRKKKKYQNKNVNNNARKTSQTPAVKEETELVKPLPIGDKQGLSEEDIIIEESVSAAEIDEAAAITETAVPEVSDLPDLEVADTAEKTKTVKKGEYKSLWICLAFFAGSFLYWEIIGSISSI